LSGGELARVHIARALACDVSILLADEPVAALDPRHQMSVMHLFRSMVNRGGSALVILHDLTLAARFADRIIGMKEGRIVIDAKPAEVISPPVVRDLFGIEIEVTHGQGWPQPVVVG
jgi:iron complex transport system ATP-binding protein